MTAASYSLDALPGLCYGTDMQKVRQPVGMALMILAFPAAIYGAFPWGIALGAFLFLLGVVCRNVKRVHAVVAVILGLLVIAWMSLSPLINEGSPFYCFRSSLHTYLTIVFGTVVIFLTGFLLTKFAKKTI